VLNEWRAAERKRETAYMARDLSAEEGAVLDAFLQGDWLGSEPLRQQAREIRVSGKCGCGCATVEFTVDSTNAPQAPPQNPAPKEATVWNDDRTQVIGGILLFAPDGYLSSMEIYTFTDNSIEVFPPLDRIDFELSTPENL
jgi:hypothetical protein